MRGKVEIEPVRAGRRNGGDTSGVPGVPRIDDDDLGWIGDVHIEDLGVRIVDRPAGPAGHADLGQHRLRIEIDHGYRLRSGYLRIADIRGQNQPSGMIVGEPVWMDADIDFQHLRSGPGSKTPIVFSARFDVMMSCASSLTRTPATPGRRGTENKCFPDAGSKTSTASF